MYPGPGRPLAPSSGLRPSGPLQGFGPGWESECPWMEWACWGQRSGEGCNPTCPPRSQAPQCPVSLSISFPISRSPQRPLSGQKLPPTKSPQHEGGRPFPICLGQDPEMKGWPCQGQTPRGPKGVGCEPQRPALAPGPLLAMCPHPRGDKSSPLPPQHPAGGGPKHSLEEPPCRQSRGRLGGPDPALLRVLAPPGQGCGSGVAAGTHYLVTLAAWSQFQAGEGLCTPGGVEG